MATRYSALAEEADSSIQAMKDYLTSIITDCAISVGSKIVRRHTGKLSHETKDLIKKRQSMKASIPTDRITLTELSKLINRRKIANIRMHNMERIEHALKNAEILKAGKRNLGRGKNEMYALRDKEGNATTNMNKIVNVAEEFYRDLQ